ncbi:hypothetical protein SAICODRAFT_26288 [Saitoella complicata NRRL Y-17804]|uniref:Altered inheritance of mitochondria protein 32 n=1 Tax=Saitoella complicata (strain BCRC 22490 / CBS 7301 / JCM 7358 / NBRC 10748 / NRRL Y-17804) TaxID=698492 RepID=A0A0E9NPK5_SAICN|nr:uncharacterized protein SAICODRAFT_26288 [Saitoella complicata NRRL Y-17804]ODQ51867.1 hypothetical protein SAICODRAFT_26288 [Saitoella complicata NRRL Y-17804]GAO51769.1 hypothetical protein G7K_5862-t1 [Saitoella complicata NRRL Y-17804]
MIRSIRLPIRQLRLPTAGLAATGSRSFASAAARRESCACGSNTHLTYPDFKLPLNTTTPLSTTGPSLWRHIILATGPKTQDTWPHNPNKDPDSIAGVLEKMQKERPDAREKPIMIGLATLPKSTVEGMERLWVFPEGVCVDVSSADVESGRIDVWRHLLKPSEELEEMFGPEEGEEGGVILICGHTARDPRCALAGPILLSQFLSPTSPSSQLPPNWKVALTTHVGGHAYAGNVIVYSRHPKRGVWYGRVTPCDVEEIVGRTVRGGEVVERLLRGVVEVEAG